MKGLEKILLVGALGFSTWVWGQQGQIPAGFAQAESPSAEVKESVGAIKATSGVVSLQSAEGKNRFASEGSKLYVGDVVTTQKGSTAVLKFIDTTQVALRPQTRFVVEDYAFKPDEPVGDRAQFNLVKGGLRTLTGLIGKRGDEDAFALKSRTATIGIRGTDFAARLCEGDECEQRAAEDQQSVTSANTSTAAVAGRIAQLSGKVTAKGGEGDVRTLTRGAPVFAGDVLTSEATAFAVVTMADATRLTIPGGSEMSIDAYRYAPAAPKSSVASFKLLKGAVRFVTGAIGKAEPDNVKFSTETATIGIRGTGGDISCVPASGPGGATVVSCSGGNVRVNVDMRSGTVIVTTPQGTLSISEGQSGFIALNGQPPVLSPVPLNTLQNIPNSGPLPESVPANFESLSVTELSELPGQSPDGQQGKGQGGQKNSPRLFVSVNDGKISVRNAGSDQPTTVSRGQGLFILAAPGFKPLLLNAPPKLLAEDNKLSQPAFTSEAQQCTPG